MHAYDTSWWALSPRRWLAAGVLAVAGAIALPVVAQEQPIELVPPPAPTEEGLAAADGADPVADPNAEVLTRGPVHEAFADQFNMDPQPGVIVTKAPPEAIQEVPPAVRPDDEDAIWIPGYFAWDDDREDFVYVSGCWRVPPPGHRWVPGYWNAMDDGRFQWVSGFWAPNDSDQLSYYPTPPASLDNGPSYPSPGDNYFWNPGYWQYGNGYGPGGGYGYGWQAGFWTPGYANWMWMPNRWMWTPRGCIFQPGRWDRRFAYRGQMFAPVWFRNPRMYAYGGFGGGFGGRGFGGGFYSPRVGLNLGSIALNLWVRPSYNHYYFGNYYGGNFAGRNFVPWYAYGTRGRTFDPMMNFYQTQYRRQGIDYRARLQGWHDHFDRHEELRPAATFKGQTDLAARLGGDKDKIRASLIGTSVTKLGTGDGDHKFTRISAQQRLQFAESMKQVDAIKRERRSVEKVAVDGAGGAKVGPGGLKLGADGKLEGRGPDGRGPDGSPRIGAGADGKVGVDGPKLKLGRTPGLESKKPNIGVPGANVQGGSRVNVDGRPGRPRIDADGAFKAGTDPKSGADRASREGVRLEGDRNVIPPRVQPQKGDPAVLPPNFPNRVPKVDGGTRLETPKVEPRKIETPKIETRKIETPRIEGSGRVRSFDGNPGGGIQTPKIETPKAIRGSDSGPKFTPRVNVQPQVTPRINVQPQVTPRVNVNPQPRISTPRVESTPKVSPRISTPSFTPRATSSPRVNVGSGVSGGSRGFSAPRSNPTPRASSGGGGGRPSGGGGGNRGGKK